MTQHPNGAWIWRLSKQHPDYLNQLKQVKCQRVYLKAFDGRSRSMFWKDQCTPEIIKRFNESGIEVYGWGYHYGTSEDIVDQIDAVRQAMDCGLNGYVLDLEKEVEDVRTHNPVKILLQALRPYIEAGTLGYTSFGYPRYHPNIPWRLLDDLCDFAMPQMYFEKWTSNPDKYKEWVEGALKSHNDLGLKKPILPIWGSESDTSNPSTAAVLQDYLNRYQGSAIWRLPNSGERGEAWNLNYSGVEVIPDQRFEQQQAARAVFKMDLKYSSGLLYGNIFLFDAEGKQIFDAVATTGRPGYQTPSHIWQQAKGPIPDMEGLAIGTEDTIIESSEMQDWSFPILPHVVKNPDSRGIDRGSFRIYNDAGTPGTPGGIGILNANSFNHFRALLISLQQQGIEQIPLRIEYTKPKATLPASAVFKLSRARTGDLLEGSLSVLDDRGETIFETVATSGLPGYQSADDNWIRARGCIPSEEMIVNGPIRISTYGYHSGTSGIEGQFFPILPLYFRRADGYTRSEFGVHYDANVPGSAGCVVIRCRSDFDIFIDLMKKAERAGRQEIALAIVYTDGLGNSRGFVDEWWQQLLEARRQFV